MSWQSNNFASSYISMRVFQKKKFILFFGNKILSLLNCFFFMRYWINAMSSMDISVLISSTILPLYSNHSSLKTNVKVFLPRARTFLTWRPFDNWISIQTFHPLEQMSRFLCQGKNQCFYFSLLLTTLWLFVYSADRLLPFFHMTFETIILINTKQDSNNTLNLSLFSLSEGLILSSGFRELSYDTCILTQNCVSNLRH